MTPEEIRSLITDAVEATTKAAMEKILGASAEDMTERLAMVEQLRAEADEFAAQLRTITQRAMAGELSDPYYRGNFRSAEQATRFGNYVLAAAGCDFARKALADDDVELVRAMGEGTGSTGGYLVPEEFATAIIRNVEQYGVARRNCLIVPMSRDKMSWPKLASSITCYYPGEGTAITASDLGVSQVNLSAVKYAALSVLSNELDEDSAIPVAELTADEFARRFAQAEDTNAFLGDGTSTYARTVGLVNAVGSAGVVTAASGDDTFVEIEYDKFSAAVAKLPSWALPNAKWYMHHSVFLSQLGRVDTTGAPLIKEFFLDGLQRPTFCGLPVEFVNVMPSTSASTQASTACAIVGDLRKGVMLGTRRQLTLARSSEYKFAEDQFALRAIQRIDVNVHEGGSSTAPGAYVVVKAAAS